MSIHTNRLLQLLGVVIFFTLSLPSHAESPVLDSTKELPDRIIGDVGMAVYSTNLHIGSYGPQTTLLPYGFFDYQRFSMRIDQLALKTLPIGFGFLEVVGKVDPDTFKVKSTINGQTINKGYQIPMGLGTFQETPLGVFMINAYHDFGKSKGNLLELNYFGEIELPHKVVIYPQVGLERQSSSYANYYYSITPEQSQLTGYKTYTATGTNNPIGGFLLEIPVVDNWIINLYGKRKWLGSAVSNSPVLTRSFQDTVFLALAYRFK